MPRRLFLALLFLVAAPLVLLGWVSATAIRVNEREAKEQWVALLSPQLDAANQVVGELFDDYAEELDAQLDGAGSDLAAIVERLRRMRRTVPIVRQGIVTDPDGRLVFPPANDSLDSDTIEVFAALPGLVDSRPSLPVNSSFDQTNHAEKQTKRLSQFESRWQQWYMSNGAQVVYWRLADNGTCVGVLLERSRWMADVIAALPSQTPQTGRTPQKRISTVPLGSSSFNDLNAAISKVVLVDESKRPIYLWGRPGTDESPLVADRELPMPLSSWQFRLYVDPALTPKSNPLPIYLSLLSIGLILLVAGGYVLTSVQRQIADAKTRVSFAGQVSHELRTPLTNIRLYTELAESDLAKLEESEGKASIEKRLDVIHHESRRLQRLVSGVLEMIRPGGEARGSATGVRRQPTSVDDLLNQIVAQFQPSFAAAGLSLEICCDVGDELDIDPDVIEMVIVNLLSNVEKYVPAGGHCLIRCVDQSPQSGRAGNWLVISVDDDGPGINAADHKRIFQPFQRLDDSIHAPSGTGIGLTIARRAAERHGGQLSIGDHPELGGASFELRIPVGPKP